MTERFTGTDRHLATPDLMRTLAGLDGGIRVLSGR